MVSVLVLGGGTSDEREVSLRSGQNVKSSLEKAGYNTSFYDPATADTSLSKAVEGHDVVFSALHGAGGEDGVVQAQLDRLQVPYVGSGVYTSELCFDKWNYRALLQSHGLPMAEGELVDFETYNNSELIKSAYILKPPKGGSSIDTIPVRDPSKANQSIITADFQKHRQLLLERLIPGVEITVGVLDNAALPVIEIIPPIGKEFDYENKYNGATRELCPPEHVSEELQKRAQELAFQIHQLTGCRDMSRTDMMIDIDGKLFVLETNTIPGLTEQSLLPKAAAAAGYDMPALVDRLVKAALSRSHN